MKLKICWMYHDLMDLYGDKGNIQVLKTRCEKRGIECIVDTCTLDEEKILADYDLLFIGGGADREQGLLVNDLLKRRDAIQEAMDQGSFILLIYGQKIEGLKFFDYYTEAASRSDRCIGNIAVEAALDNERIIAVGFENHGGQTKGVNQPFGKVLKGHGNTYQSAFEGFYNGQVLGTYMHGPLLPKNPEIADFILRKALAKRHGECTLEPLNDMLEHKAKEVMLKRLGL